MSENVSSSLCLTHTTYVTLRQLYKTHMLLSFGSHFTRVRSPYSSTSNRKSEAVTGPVWAVIRFPRMEMFLPENGMRKEYR